MKDQILQTLRELRAYARQKGYAQTLWYQEEDSALMRFANSAISLNTRERLVRLTITAYAAGRKRASCRLITNLDRRAEIQQAMDTAAEMAEQAHPLTYAPTLPELTETFEDESAYDPALAPLSNAERLHYFNAAAAGLETEALKLSGIFSSGATTFAQINTRADHTQYFRASDAQIKLVLAHTALKWEVTAEQSAQQKADLDPARVRQELACLLSHYQADPPQRLALGRYDVVLGAAALATLLNYLNWIGFNGGAMKRGYACLTEAQVGQRVFSDQFTLVDDPDRRETFPLRRDFTGLVRRPCPVFEAGVFRQWLWSQDDADEFGAQPTGHTVPHKSLVLQGGRQAVGTLAELIALPREKDLLYVPFLHYTNIVNPSQGLITGSSRFGALWLKADGSVQIPYNVRLTQSLPDYFGDRVAWLSQTTVPDNTSVSYGGRNPAAIIVPAFMRVNDLEISHSNASY